MYLLVLPLPLVLPLLHPEEGGGDGEAGEAGGKAGDDGEAGGEAGDDGEAEVSSVN